MDDQRVIEEGQLMAEENRNSASSTPMPPEDPNANGKADDRSVQLADEHGTSSSVGNQRSTRSAVKAGAESLDELSREELIDRVQRQMGMLQKLKSRYDDRNNKCKTMADEIGQLETGLKEANRQNEQLLAELKSASAGKSKGLLTMEIEDYQRTIDLLEQRITSKQKSIDVLNDELEQLRSLNSRIQNDHAGIQASNATIKQQFEKERNQRAELEVQLEQARDVHASVRNEMATKFADVEEMRGELEHEKFGKHKLALRIAELEDVVNRQNENAANLRQANDKSCADADRLKEQLHRVEQEFKLYKLKAQRAAKDNNNNVSYAVDGAVASHDNSRITANVLLLEAELSELQRKYETEQLRLQQAHDTVSALKAENRALKQQQQDMLRLNNNHRHAVSSDTDSGAGSELSSGSNYSAIQNRRPSVTERDYDELLQQKDQQIRAVSNSHAELSSENSRQKRQIDELTSQMNILRQKLSDVDRSGSQTGIFDHQKTDRLPSVDISIQTDRSLLQRLSPDRNPQQTSMQKPHYKDNAISRQRSLPQRQGSRRNSDRTNGSADRRVIYSRNTVSGDGQFGVADDADGDIAAGDTKSSTSTLSQSASQVVPRPRSRQNTLSYSTSSFEDLLLAPVTIQTSKIDYESSRANCMNELLNESQAMNRHLTTQIAFLKDEVRRLEANAERLNHVHNMEYLKNVLLKFLTHSDSTAGGAEREHLVEVLATMLKLTKQERKALLTNKPANAVATSGNGANSGGGEWTGLISRWTSVTGKK